MGDIHQLILRHGLERARDMAETATDRQAVEAAAAVLGDEAARMGVTHAGFAMTSLPHKRVAADFWERDGGVVRLTVESGREKDRTPIGIPYGAVARMILLYLQTQAVRTRSREVELGASMNAWLGAMGISVGGKTYALVREQARRISRCRLTFVRRAGGVEAVTNAAFVREAILPNLDYTRAEGQLTLWQERATLDEGFYASLIEHPLPLREAAIREISGRSMAIDVYIWLAYRLHALSRPTPISWASVYGQFGAGYRQERLRDLKPVFIDALKLSLAVYPEAQVEVDEGKGLLLLPSPPPVVERHRRIA
jgi:replication initiator protein